MYLLAALRGRQGRGGGRERGRGWSVCVRACVYVCIGVFFFFFLLCGCGWVYECISVRTEEARTFGTKMYAPENNYK